MSLPPATMTSVSPKGIVMLLSPAKTLDLSPLNEELIPPTCSLTLPSCDVTKTSAIATVLKRYSKAQLAQQFKLSANLAQSTHDHWQAFSTNHGAPKTDVFRKPCIYTYSGPAFQGLDVSTLSKSPSTSTTKNNIAYLQDNLRILDAVYGILRPLDQIQAYRLELNTKLESLPSASDTKSTKLVDYWSAAVSDWLMNEIQARIEDCNDDTNDGVILLNLASEEYAALLKPPHFLSSLPNQCRYLQVIFRDDGRIVSVHAKRARGLMVRHVVECQATTLADIQAFCSEGYAYNAQQSTESQLVFDRTKSSAKSAVAAKAKPTATSARPKRAKEAKQATIADSKSTEKAKRPKR